MVLTSFTVNASAAEVNSDTILGGSNRFETAIKISENGWSTSDRAVLINGEKGLVDALTATPYAYTKNAPILITASGKLTPATANRLTKMGVKNVDVVGGTNSVSEGVVTELKNKGITVNRISGASRYDTSLAVAKEIDKIQDVAQIAVVNGDKGIPDAVSVAAPAASKKMPILLAENNGLNAASKKFVDGEGVTKSYVIGSTNSVSDGVMNSLPGTKTRLGGANRHDTNAAVIKEFYTATSLSNIYVAKSGMVKSKDEIVDALSAGVLAAKNGNPIVLVGNNIETSQQSLLASKKFTKMTQIGMGVPANSVNQIKATQADEESVVSSVTVKSYNTILLKGRLLDKASVSLSGNTVKSYTADSTGTEATVVFNNGFSSTNNLTVTSNLGNKTNHTFTYSTDISSVQATSKEVSNVGIQYLEITTNNSIIRSVDELKDLGWKVEFKSNEDIFYSKGGPTKTSEDGKVEPNLQEGKTFYYEVVLTKGSTVLTSERRVVEVVNRSNQYKSINSYELKRVAQGTTDSAITLKSKTFVAGEEFDIVNLKVTNKNNQEDKIDSIINSTEFEVKSSNPSAVSVSGISGQVNRLKAVSNGTSKITITNGKIEKVFDVKVDIARKPTKVSYSKSPIYVSSKTTNGAVSKVEEFVTLVDQYDDPFDGYDFGKKDEVVKTGGTNSVDIAKVTLGKTDSDGKAKLVITPIAEASGSVEYELISGNDKWSKVKIEVENIDKASSVKLELADKTKDSILDIYSGKNDKSVVLNLNEYNGNYFYQKITNIGSTISDKGYSVSSSNNDVATVSIKNGDITVTAVKKGTVNIRLYEGKDEKASLAYMITVEDSIPKVTSIDLNDVAKVTKADVSYNPAEALLKLTDNIVEGINVSQSTENIIYVPRQDTKLAELRLGSVDGNIIAKIEIDPTFTKTIGVDGSVDITNVQGEILVKFFTGYNSSEEIITTGSPYKVGTIKVDTK